MQPIMKLYMSITALVAVLLVSSTLSEASYSNSRFGFRKLLNKVFPNSFNRLTVPSGPQSRGLQADAHTGQFLNPGYGPTPGLYNENYGGQNMGGHGGHGATTAVAVAKHGASSTSSAEGSGSTSNAFADGKQQKPINPIYQSGGQYMGGVMQHGMHGMHGMNGMHGMRGIQDGMQNCQCPGPNQMPYSPVNYGGGAMNYGQMPISSPGHFLKNAAMQGLGLDKNNNGRMDMFEFNNQNGQQFQNGAQFGNGYGQGQSMLGGLLGKVVADDDRDGIPNVVDPSHYRDKVLGKMGMAGAMFGNQTGYGHGGYGAPAYGGQAMMAH